MAYRYANQSEVKELTAWCMEILHAVQEEIREYFTFDIRLIGSGDKRLVTQNSDEAITLKIDNTILQGYENMRLVRFEEALDLPNTVFAFGVLEYAYSYFP